jgi:phospholipid/cholesterol/gamma-HCH transport system substrate-binding protein
MRRWLVAVAVVLGLVGSGCSGLFGNGDDPRVIAYFTDVGDLVEGGQVQVNDVEVGMIDEIELVLVNGHMNARVTMTLDPSVKISATDLHARIRQTSLLGEQFVELRPVATTPPYVDSDGAEVPVENTDRLADIETFLSDLSGFIASGAIEDLNTFTHAQALILEDRGARFGETLEELDRFTAVLSDRRLDVGAAIENLASASGTLAQNRDTLNSFLDSLDEANQLLADEGPQLRHLFQSLRRFGTVNARFLAKHEDAIGRQFKALRPILDGLAGAQGELRTDLSQLSLFFELFPKSLGGGPGGAGTGDYIQADAILCETLSMCDNKGQKGDVPGQGS